MKPEGEKITLRQLLAEGQSALSGEDAQLEAWLLLESVFSLDRAAFWLRCDEAASPEGCRQYRQRIARRQAGEPVAYILEKWEFMGLPFRVSSAVLIPRPDTETLVEEVLAWAGNRPLQVLDLCTGSGCIAVSLAKYLPQACVDAADISPEAINIAGGNAALNQVTISVYQGDLWEAVPAGRQYDVITANPPYIDEEEMKQLSRDVREYEPRLALDGGADGLTFYRRLAAELGRFLKPAGRAFWEIGYRQAAAVTELARQAGLRVVTVKKDLAGHDRVVIVERGKNHGR